MRNLRWLLLGLVVMVLVASLAALVLAVEHGRKTQQNVSLGLAFGAIALTVAKILLDMFVTPQGQALGKRRARHEERVESVAGQVRQLLGLKGSMILGEVEDAWKSHDPRALRDNANVLADAASLAYGVCETANDPLEILVGVVMVEAGELSSNASALESMPPAQWDRSDAASHLRLAADYLERVQDRLNEILDRGRDQSE